MIDKRYTSNHSVTGRGVSGGLPPVRDEQYKKRLSSDEVSLFLYWVGESNSYCEIENLEY